MAFFGLKLIVCMFVCRMVVVMLESLSGSGHRLTAIRKKTEEKLEKYSFDPWGKVLYSSEF